jgi:hypothetical protein
MPAFFKAKVQTSVPPGSGMMIVGATGALLQHPMAKYKARRADESSE